VGGSGDSYDIQFFSIPQTVAAERVAGFPYKTDQRNTNQSPVVPYGVIQSIRVPYSLAMSTLSCHPMSSCTMVSGKIAGK